MIESRTAVRPATEGDLPTINDIYNVYVVESHFTFDLEPMTMSGRLEWFSHYAETGRHRVMVAAIDDRVVGYACSSRFRPKPGYLTSVETSVYLTAGATRLGLGTRLYEALFDAIRSEVIHRAYAGIALPNPASVALHERFGFRQVAHFTEQGCKFGRYWDVAWFEKPMGGEPAS
ncbi:MAG: GNAT family N-acetyltransferase [Candidatus Dormibacterales bacterium]